jgi:hypothetical protein
VRVELITQIYLSYGSKKESKEGNEESCEEEGDKKAPLTQQTTPRTRGCFHYGVVFMRTKHTLYIRRDVESDQCVSVIYEWERAHAMCAHYGTRFFWSGGSLAVHDIFERCHDIGDTSGGFRPKLKVVGRNDTDEPVGIVHDGECLESVTLIFSKFSYLFYRHLRTYGDWRINETIES